MGEYVGIDAPWGNLPHLLDGWEIETTASLVFIVMALAGAAFLSIKKFENKMHNCRRVNVKRSTVFKHCAAPPHLFQ